MSISSSWIVGERWTLLIVRDAYLGRRRFEEFHESLGISRNVLTERLTRLALIGPVGVKTGPPDKLDIPDIFAMSQEALDRLRFHDPRNNPLELAAMSDDELFIAARNRETLALIT